MSSAGSRRAAKLSMLGEKPGHSSDRGSERKRSKKRGLGNPERQSGVKNGIFITFRQAWLWSRGKLTLLLQEKHMGQVHQGYMTNDIKRSPIFFFLSPFVWESKMTAETFLSDVMPPARGDCKAARIHEASQSANLAALKICLVTRFRFKNHEWASWRHAKSHAMSLQ